MAHKNALMGRKHAIGRASFKNAEKLSFLAAPDSSGDVNIEIIKKYKKSYFSRPKGYFGHFPPKKASSFFSFLACAPNLAGKVFAVMPYSGNHFVRNLSTIF